MKLISTNLDKTLSFDSYQGVKYKNLKFVGILDAATVRELGKDPIGGHVQNLPYLPDPKPTLYTDYPYAKFVDAEGKATYLGVPWVNETSIVQNDSPNYQILLTAPTQQQLDSVKSMMLASGIENFKVSAL